MGSKRQDTCPTLSPVIRRIQLEKGYQLVSESSTYIVEKVLGEGSFGYVVKCLKSATNGKVALKVAKTVKPSQVEEVILRKLQGFDQYFIRFENSFIHRDHVCHEFELLDISLFEFMKKRSRLTLPEVRKILHQTASALQILYDFGIVHSDIKPENIMMVDHARQPLRIKLIDFGCSFEISGPMQAWLIQSLWYRAPEIILGCPFNNSIDMWSLGCVATEIFLGFPLYDGQTEHEMLSQITSSHGPFPQAWLCNGWWTAAFYNLCSGNIWKLKSQKEYGIRLKCHLTEGHQFLMNPRSYLSKRACTEELCDMKAFMDLLRRMLSIDPNERIRPSEVLNHSFIKMDKLMTSFVNGSYVQKSIILMGECSKRSSGNMSQGSPKRKKIKLTISDEEQNFKTILNTCKDAPSTVIKLIPQGNPLELSQKRKRSSSNPDHKFPQILRTSKNATTILFQDKTQRRSSGNMSEGSVKRNMLSLTTDVKEKHLTAMQKQTKGVTTEVKEKGLIVNPPTSKDSTSSLIQRMKENSKSLKETSNHTVKNVWIIGSSQIVRGKTAAYDIFGENFGLNAKVTWFGQEDMRWKDVLPCFYAEASKKHPPDILVVHAGSNDLGLMPCSDLGLQMRKNLVQLHEEFPSMKIVYSSMTDQNQWNGKPPRVIIDRRSINQRMIRVAYMFDGEVIEHQLKGHNSALFLPDGVNFSKEGNEIFLARIRSAIEKILDKGEPGTF